MTTILFRPILAATILAAVLGTGAAQAEKMNSIVGDDGKTLSFTPCALDDAAECIAYDMDCRGDGGFGSGLSINVSGAEEGGPNARAMAKALIDKPWGEAKVQFSVGGKAIEIQAHSVTVSTNEMNGDWDLGLHTYDPGAFLEALTEKNAGKVSLKIADQSFVLAEDKAGAANLMKFKKACTQ